MRTSWQNIVIVYLDKLPHDTEPQGSTSYVPVRGSWLGRGAGSFENSLAKTVRVESVIF